MARNETMQDYTMYHRRMPPGSWNWTVLAIIVVAGLLLLALTAAIIAAAIPPYVGAGNVGP